MSVDRWLKPAWVSLVFGVVAAALGERLRLIDDEAYITWLGATTLREAAAAGYFFQKFHPTLSVIYSPFAALGWRAFLVAHCAFGALGVFLAGSLAQRFRLPGGVTSAVLALSPVYLLAAASGQSNSDGVTLLLLAIWLSALRERRAVQALAGVAFAAALWSRYELALAIGLFGLQAATHPRTRWVLAGLTGAALAYLFAGAAYHRDALWWLRYSPTLLTSLPGVPIGRFVPRSVEQLLRVASQLSAVSVAWVIAATVRGDSLTREARSVRVAFWITLAAMVGIPFARVLNFIHSPRYLSVVLPFTAILVGAWVASPSSALRSLAPAAVLALLAVTRGARELGAPLVFALLLPLGARLRTVGARGIFFVALAAASLLVTARTTSAFREGRADEDVLGAARWIRDNARGRAVYTNDQHLALTLRAEGRPPRYLVAFDIQLELMRLLDARNGQRERVLRALSPELYGIAAWACEIDRRPPPPGSLFVLGADDRLQRFFSGASWEASTRAVVSFGALRVLEMRHDGPPLRSAPDPILQITPAQVALPCEVLGITAPR